MYQRLTSPIIVIALLLMPLLATAQLKEFEVSEMERPDVPVVQGNTQWPDDALLFVYSTLKDLNFRSSLGAIDKVSYNGQSNRYEVFFKPNKQMLFVYANNFVELKIETFNPNPKDVFYYKVERKQQAVVNTKPGTLKIITEPSGADVFVNGMRMADKTTFTGELPGAFYNIKLQKAKHETIDTTVAVRSGEPSVMNLQMKPTTLWVNINSAPSGASVTLDGTSYGTTPASFEMDLTDKTKRGSKKLQFILADHEVMDTLVELQGGKTFTLNANLKPTTLWINLVSVPSGANLILDGIPRGTTPVSFEMDLTDKTKRGSKQLQLSLSNYQSISTNIDLEPSSAPVEFKYSLQKETGSFSINSAPEGAEVFIGGQYKGTTPLQGAMEIGQYDVEVKLENYFSPKQNLTVSTNGSNEVNFSMRDRSELPIDIGQAYGGGIVFELNEDGHGLVVCFESLGYANIQEAKNRCIVYEYGGYNDWYLPKIKDLKKLYQAIGSVDKSLKELGIKELIATDYWGVITGAKSARSFSLATGKAKTVSQGAIHAVRPVRAF